MQSTNVRQIKVAMRDQAFIGNARVSCRFILLTLAVGLSRQHTLDLGMLLYGSSSHLGKALL